MKKIIALILAVLLVLTAIPAAYAEPTVHTYEELQKLYDTVVNYIFKAEKTLKVIMTDEEDEFCYVPLLAAKELLLSLNYSDEETTYAYNGLRDTLSMLMLIVQRNNELTSGNAQRILSELSRSILDENYYSLVNVDLASSVKYNVDYAISLMSDRSGVSDLEFANAIQELYSALYTAAKLKISYCNQYFATFVFSDVKKKDWFFDAVNFVYQQGLFKGTSQNTFSPSMQMTRGMFITVLSRFAYAETNGYVSTYTDVAADTYYAAPIGWAQANGIINWAQEGSFAPDYPITREEIVTCMYNYANFMGFDSSAYDLTFADRITDIGEAYGFATDGIRWAFSVGVISGYGDNSVKPKGTATRAEVAQVFINLQTVLSDK